MCLRDDLEEYFPAEEIEDLFAGCCMLYDAVGDETYVDENFEVTLLFYKDTVQEWKDYTKEFERTESRKYNIDDADTFYAEEYLLKHKSGKEVVVHQLFRVCLNDSWEESSMSLSLWSIEVVS